MLQLSLRLGKRPRWLLITTPKPISCSRSCWQGKDIVVTRGSKFENEANPAPTVRAAILQGHERTRLGRQELNAELLWDSPGALWQLD
jgi:phage terminase large subunit-like protein